MTKDKTDTPPDSLTTEEQKGLIISIIADMADDDPDKLLDYLNHVGFDITALRDSSDLFDAWVAHYRLGQGSYDVDEALMDFRTWPPISRRIFELMDEQKKLAK